MMMVLAVGATAAVGAEEDTQFEQITAEMGADASGATFEAISGKLTLSTPRRGGSASVSFEPNSSRLGFVKPGIGRSRRCATL
jgi:hypothetical protein